ncbi:NAD(P)-binding protein [Coemansia reversa NRRL 1564]|uniref:3-dehydrosphinganine reductase n=1 Tax=Coemansia reversa (strain ATCC 12441 / NRRL 1564) TaxID=763665 RepID=A0A2G5BL25_COERN|nr:NAD(P)-binding protein [Coemansia reversa NRRL 1564]|eukprot:PIA19703.1 NAD(P)-binding protein [Coemansia reversa NRRL 1564]
MEDWRVGLVTFFSVLAGLLAIGVANEVYLRLSAAKIKVNGKHCYVTGGSQGLGKCVALDLARRGANVTIVARREEVLKEAVREIKACAIDPKQQQIEYVVADITNSSAAVEAIETAVTKQKQPIEYLFNVAGISNPGVFLEQSPELIRKTMDLNYFGTVYTTHEVAKRMVTENIKGGHIIMVSSVLGFFGLVGYGAYCPTKFAVRGLAEALRVELQAHGINVHCYFPGTIFTPGYDLENLTKPEVTKEIEGADEGMTPEKCSAGLFKGLERGEFGITTDPIGMLLRCGTRGVMPNNNFMLDTIISGLAWIIFAPWRVMVDRTVIKYASKQHSK